MQEVRNIIFEGIDGSGKSTQANLLKQFLDSGISRPVHLYREPGGTPSAEYVRSILKDTNTNLSDKQKLSLFCIARKFLCDELLEQYNKDSRFISILDRFVPSTYAYQVYGADLESDLIDKTMMDICPNYIDVYNKSVVIYIDINPEKAHERITSRNKKMDDPYEKLDFLKKVYDGYDKYFSDNPNLKVLRVNGDRDSIQICNEIIDYVKWCVL